MVSVLFYSDTIAPEFDEFAPEFDSQKWYKQPPGWARLSLEIDSWVEMFVS